MGKVLCEICHGHGDFEKDGKLLECRCQVLKRIFSMMPTHILRSNILPAHLELGIHRMANKCIFIRGSWADLKPVIKATILQSLEGKAFRITSDREIRDVYVGSKSKAAHPDDDFVVYNNLQDLMEPIRERVGEKSINSIKKDIVIVRLNELSYKNKAAPGALEEALSFRIDRDKPTWVLSDPDKPFGPGSFAYSESVWDLLMTAFRGIDIPRITPRESNVTMVQAVKSPLTNKLDRVLTPHSDPNLASILPIPVIRIDSADVSLTKSKQKPAIEQPILKEEPTTDTVQSADDDAPFSGFNVGGGIKKSKFRGRY